MAGFKNSILKSSFGAAFATVLSRLTGLARVVLEARVLGGGALATAWMFAFAIPNTFRRILGEGALGSALVPLLAHTLESEGREKARHDLTAIFSFLGLLLVLISLLISGAALLAVPYVSEPRYVMTLQLLPVVMPYVFFICLTGAISAALNTLKVFFLPALSAILLNIALIACLLFVCPLFNSEPQKTLNSLGISVLIAGFVQLILMLILLHLKGMSPKINLSCSLAPIKELWHLTLPGLLGASALQISTLIDKALACYLGPQAVPALSYSDRIVYLPIGVFAVSLGAVLLSDMSRNAAGGKTSRIASSLIFGLRIILYICIPIAVFTMFFREPIIRLICLGGRFSPEDMEQTAYAMLFYAAGIPAFVSVKLILPAFYSRKEMKTPVRISIFCICVNIVLNIILMFPMRQGGIALATVIASFLNNILLLYYLRRQTGIPLPLNRIFSTLWKSLSAAGIAAVGIYYLNMHLFEPLKIKILRPDLVPVLLSGLLFCGIFLGLTFLMRCREPREIFAILKRR